MTGALLFAVARRLLRDHTFTSMVCPAIADLQFEAPGQGPLRRIVSYVAVIRVILYGLFYDARLDATLAFDAHARRHVWRRATFWYAAIVSYFAWLGVRETQMLGLDAAAASLTSALTSAVLAGFGPAMIAAAFYLSRRGIAPARTVAAATVALVALAFATAAVLHPFKASADYQLYEAGRAVVLSPGAHPALRIWLEFQADDLDTRLAWVQYTAGALAVVHFALLGVILARRRGWMVPVTLVLFVATAFGTSLLVLQIQGWFLWPPVLSREMQTWRNLAIFFVVTLAWIVPGLPAVRHAAATVLTAAARHLEPPSHA